MISAAGIKDQELTRIVSMMLIELALLRLSRFKRLALLEHARARATGRAASASLVGATGGTISLGQEGECKGTEYSEFRNPSVSGSPLEAVDAEKAGPGDRASNPSGRGVGWRQEREQDHRIAVSHDDFARRPRVITRHMSGANQLGLRSR